MYIFYRFSLSLPQIDIVIRLLLIQCSPKIQVKRPHLSDVMKHVDIFFIAPN